MWKKIDEKDIVVGKNAIENLTEGMYSNALIVYREYIQNAADGIDEAEAKGIYGLGEKPEIEINVDEKERYVSIFDNGMGVKATDIFSLINVASSDKDKNINKGFRGIGRLGGLAYCKILRFTTSYSGEPIKSIIEWDAEKLMHLLNDEDRKLTATEVIAMVVKTNEEEEEGDKHYFKVEMIDVIDGKRTSEKSIANLVNLEAVKAYITQTAPVKYSQNFRMFYPNIEKHGAELNSPIITYHVYLNGDAVFKSYRKTLANINQEFNEKVDEIEDIGYHEFYNDQKELLGWMWYGITKCSGVLKGCDDIQGIILRKDNIQIGEGAATLAHLYNNNEADKISKSFVGELFAVHKKLIPNSRRDYFIVNETCDEFEEKVTEFFDHFNDTRYLASNFRALSKKSQEEAKLIQEIEKKNNNKSFGSDEEKKDLENKLKKVQKEKADKEKKVNSSIKKTHGWKDAEETLQLLKDELEKELEKINATNSGIGSVADGGKQDYSSKQTQKDKIETPDEQPHKESSDETLANTLLNLTENERKVVGCVYNVLYKVLPREEYDSLINKIQAELRKL